MRMKILDEKYKESFSNKLNGLFEEEKWHEAKVLLEEEKGKFPNEYFLITSLAKVYYNLKLYKESLSYAEKAMGIEPNDVLVIYDYGCALSALDKNNEAIKQWDRIIEMDINKIAYGDFGEGLKWAKSIINDSRYRKAICSLGIGDKAEAVKLIEIHLKNRQRGVYSDFSRKQVMRKQKALTSN
jgi:tetratricopeptide (TPR) repeat protein